MNEKSYIVIDIAFFARRRALGLLDDLVFEYGISLQHARRMHRECKVEADRKTWKEICESLAEGIEYMESGVAPWNSKVDKKASIQRRTVYANSYLLDYLNYKNPKTLAEKELGELEREMIRNLLEKLTKSEKECYLLSKQCLFSYSEIAEYLNISKKSVDNYISRAKNKIDKQKKKSLLVNAYMSEKNEVNE